MPTWTRKPSVIGGEAAPDDWSVLRDGLHVGRVQASWSPTGTVWSWAVATGFDPAPHGRCDRLEDALAAVRDAVGERPFEPTPGMVLRDCP